MNRTAIGVVTRKIVSLKFLQNSQENTCVRVSLLIKLPIMKVILEQLLLHELNTSPF